MNGIKDGNLEAITSASGTSNANNYCIGSVYITPQINFVKLGAKKLCIVCETFGDDGNFDFRVYQTATTNSSYTSLVGGTMEPVNTAKTIEITRFVNQSVYIALSLGMWHYSGRSNYAKISISEIYLEF